MDALSTAIGIPIYWVQRKMSERQFELRTMENVYATLSFEATRGTLATATSTTGRWTFKRVGFMNPRVTVREAGAAEDLAVYWPKHWGHGWLEFAKGNRFCWKPTNFWGTERGFVDEPGDPLFVLKSGAEKPKFSDQLKTQAVVEISSRGYGLAELPLLLMLGWYLMILDQEDNAAILAATAAAVG